MTIFKRLYNVVTKSYDTPKQQTRSLAGRSFIELEKGSFFATVEADKALTYNAVYSCVDVIAKSIAQMPKSVYEKTHNGRHKIDHDQSNLLALKPNDIHTSYKFWHTMLVNYLLYGDAYALINRDRHDRPIGYVLLGSKEVSSYIVDDAIWYKYKSTTYSSIDILHISDMSIDGHRGKSRISKGSTSINQGLSLANYGSEVLEKGPEVSGYIAAKDGVTLQDGVIDAIRDQFMGYYGSSHSVGYLPQGLEYKKFEYPLPMADAQIIESKKYNVEDIYRLFNVPGPLVGDYAGVNNSIMQGLVDSFLKFTLQPIITMIEQELNTKIFRPSYLGKRYVKFNTWVLARMDMKSSIEAFNVAIQNGIMSRDEVRSKLDMNPIPDGAGAVFYVPLNMIPINQAEQYFKDGGTPIESKKE